MVEMTKLLENANPLYKGLAERIQEKLTQPDGRDLLLKAMQQQYDKVHTKLDT